MGWCFFFENSNRCRRHSTTLPSAMAHRHRLLWLRFLIMGSNYQTLRGINPKSRKDWLKIALPIAGMTTMFYTTMALLRSLRFPPDLWLLTVEPGQANTNIYSIRVNSIPTTGSFVRPYR